jgi:hypothetical protein
MHINYYKTYLQTIKNSIGTTMFQEFYVDDKDILNQWSVACAYYVSNILKQFNLTPVWRANVPRVVEDLKEKWWTEIAIDTHADKIPAWSVLVWESSHGDTYNKMHHHIGFYIGNELAVSNNSIHFTNLDEAWNVPVQHHYTYNNQRQLTYIFTWDRHDIFAPRLFHYEQNIPFIWGTWEDHLASQWLSQQEIFFWSGKKEWLEYGRLCGVSCVSMALRYFGVATATLKDCIDYANTPIHYITPTGQEKSATCFVQPIGRYHSWLIHIAQNIWKKHNLTIAWTTHQWTSDDILNLLKTILVDDNAWKQQVLIASVSLWFKKKEWKQWWHLVILNGLDFNGHELSVVCLDPIGTWKWVLNQAKILIPREKFLESFSGNYIILD